MKIPRVKDIRQDFLYQYRHGYFVTNPRDGKEMLEILGASFIADEPAIFGEPNQVYIDAEIEWYKSQSLNINDIYPDKDKEPPKAWQFTANPEGFINSNYGWCIWSQYNFSQYENARDELLRDPSSRRATMIYQRPSMWYDWSASGKNDFVCTNAVTYYIRDAAGYIMNNLVDAPYTEMADPHLHCVVQMRSNDAWAGYRNDYAWQKYILDQLAEDIDVKPGQITWQVQNLHVYENQFYLLHHFQETGDSSILKRDYDKIYTKGN